MLVKMCLDYFHDFRNRYYCHPTRNTHISILARTFTSYLSLLEQTRLDQLYEHLVEEVTEWISKLFKYVSYYILVEGKLPIHVNII